MHSTDYSSRKNIIIGVFLLVAIIFIIRLFYLQVINSSYKLSADNIVLRKVREYPPRGLIYDRYGKLMVFNEAAYDLMVIPRQMKDIDTSLICEITGIDKLTFEKKLRKAKRYSYYKPSTYMKQISKKDIGKIQEKLYQIPGLFIQTRTLRQYPYPIAGHLLGSIGEVSKREIEKDNFYKPGDYIGKSGIENYYEEYLRGKSGLKIVEVDVHNRLKGKYSNGKFDTIAVAGKDIFLGIDADLQLYGEQLMQNKKGSIVAIEPKTGEILALISSPGYNPNLLVGRERSENYSKLLKDTLIPLMNRATMGTYPPGSTFKMVNALVGLQDKTLTKYTEYGCKGQLSLPIKCTHDHKTPLNLSEAIEQSCNPYFWNTYKSILENPSYSGSHEGYEHWYENVTSFGFGKKFKTDIPFEVRGNIPNNSYFDKLYRGSWNSLTVRSLSIGQGEILVTPIQLANLSTIIANRGYYYPPHLLTKMEGQDEVLNPYFNEKQITSIDPDNFDVVRTAMLDVFEADNGTARWYKLDSIKQCGKTGTVQNPHGDDHSIFIAFAPMDNPQIAISVIVENSGFGSTWAAPIASLLIEKYLNGESQRKSLEKKIMEGNLLQGDKNKRQH
ncbi:MAG: penicillin-binding protein 2 [Bacteroidales bacterium]|jgi:penicillin-binding protein 2|nr:penicillin-binding protein 2 [Lentimicrobiaceae bacterium]MDG1136205.1 penicillin-binding protein 2 [Bacteroidales bacterium]MDG1901354.1 penicillin-binding protein 2 [Bacteroidales bacterium]MDG2081179.1 penicillin-binding protein 2 [Bacteroidales bacterium]|tara:strand:- start:36390 stop:38228 length:1839 start_codon:yes stop_codon:yes gene_type:complete